MGAVPACPSMCAYTCPGPLVDGTDATPVSAVPTRPDIRAGTRPGPVSTGRSVSRVEQPRSSKFMCAGTLLGRVVQRRHCRQALPSSPEYACRYTSRAGSRREATQVGTAAALARLCVAVRVHNRG